MKEAAPSQRVVRFGGFEVDLRNGEVRKQGFKVRLQDQPFHVLQILLEHPGELVSREELQRQIWPADTFVDFEKGLNNAIKRLREALGDSAETPRFIETLPRRGYRFIAPVTSTDGSVGGQEITSSNERREPRRWFRWGAATASVAGIAAATLIGLKALRVRDRGLAGTPVPRIQSLAVLPLVNLSGDPAQEYFSDGMTDALITELAQISSVRVISRTSVMHYKKTDKTLPEIARELNVDGIVEGTVQRSGDRLRITAQLIHAASDRHLWANSYERDVRGVFLLERDVAGDIAGQVRARLTTDNRAQLARQRPVNPAALEAYLQGNAQLHRFSRGFGDEEADLASKYFRQAIDAEPDFAPAYIGMYNAHRTFRSSIEDEDISKRAAERAVELDPTLSAGWVALGDVKIDSWDWAGAEQNYRRGLSLNPSDAFAHEHLGWVFDALGQLDEGWKEAEIAQQLDPNEEHLEAALGIRHEFDQVIQHTTTMLKADPDNGVLHLNLWEGYAGKGMYKEAVEQLEKASVLFGYPETAGKLREAFAASGYRGAMRKIAEELERLQAANQLFVPINTADFWVAAGDKQRALYWLDQACKRRDRGIGGVPIVFLNREPWLEPLHSDPRYRDLLRRVGLPP